MVNTIDGDSEVIVSLVVDFSVFDDDIASYAAEFEVFDTVSADSRTVVVIELFRHCVRVVESERVLNEKRDRTERTPAAEIRTAVFCRSFRLRRLIPYLSLQV